MYQVNLHMGHNNDPVAWNISGMCSTSNSWLMEVPPFLNYAHSLMLGYSHYCFITLDLGQSEHRTINKRLIILLLKQ
jgi:hypothetical protein